MSRSSEVGGAFYLMSCPLNSLQVAVDEVKPLAPGSSCLLSVILL